MSSIIGLDIGEKRTGVAVSDSNVKIAQPIATLPGLNSLKDLLSKLKELIKQYEVVEIIVGLPILLNGGFSISTKKIVSFVDTLKDSISSIPVKLWDERLTSVSGNKMLKEVNMKGRKRKKIIDQLSAVLILQSYLESL